MATIGTFTKDDAGNYNGAIKTLTLDVKKATFRKVEKTSAVIERWVTEYIEATGNLDTFANATT